MQAKMHVDETRNVWEKTCMLVQTKMNECSSCKPKCMSEICAARALFMQTMMHTAAY